MSLIRSMAKTLLGGTRTFERLVGQRNRRISYSQFGEDVHLMAYYGRLAHDRGIVVERGCIVDVGAFRPIKYSNTYGLFRKGWRTISIDPAPGSMELFNKVRPTDTNLELAIATSGGEAIFYMFGNPSVWNTMDETAARRAEEKTGVKPHRVCVKICRLEDVLAEHLHGDSFEILSIDAEGLDLEILESANLARFPPRLILIETHGFSLEAAKDHPIVVYLEGLGYSLFSWINPNLLFVRGDSWLG